MSSLTSRPRVVLVNRAIILNREGQVLIIQRSRTNTYAPSLWEFPGGKLDIGQDITNALEREVLEETGLVILPKSRIGTSQCNIIESGKYKGLPYIELTSLADIEAGTVRLSSEHADFAWVTAEEALDYDLTPHCKRALLILQKHL